MLSLFLRSLSLKLMAFVILQMVSSKKTIAQSDNHVIVVQDYAELTERLFDLLEKKDSIKHLTIINPENGSFWTSWGIWDHEIDYQRPVFNLAHKIDTLPDLIGKFENLEYLDVSSLGLSTLSLELSELKKLRVLNISFNYINLNYHLALFSILQLNQLLAFGCSVSEIADNIVNKHATGTLIYRHEQWAEVNETVFLPKKKYYKANYGEQLIKSIITDIGKYYSIGTLTVSSYKTQNDLIQDIVESKLSGVKEKNDPWNGLIADLGKLEPAVQVQDEANLNSPSLEVNIIVENITKNNVRSLKEFKLVISLITKHLTMFFKQEYEFLKYKAVEGYVTDRIVFGVKNASEEEKRLLDQVKAIAHSHYPNHEVVDHHLLMTTPFSGGLPFLVEPENFGSSFVLYSFLFGPSPYFNCRVIF